MDGKRESGAIRVRTVLELLFIFVLAYVVVQVAPAVVLRVNFLNELELAANAPVGDSAAVIRRRVLEAAEGYGIALLSDELVVERNREAKKTTIDAHYQLFINFWPSFTYVWNVHDQVDALLF
jgi:hypothetical protein